VAWLLHLAAQSDLIPGNRTANFLCGEVALMRARDPVTLLLEIEAVVAGASEIFDGHIPMPADVRTGGGQLSGLWGAGCSEDGIQPFGDYFFIAGLHLAGRDAHAGHAGAVAAANRQAWLVARTVFCDLFPCDVQG